MLEKYNEWDYTHPRLLWGGIFIGCFVVAFLIAIGITTTVQSLVISNESARSFISTSNQIQATILAIVISLTLLAVEMTASKYSPRVIEIFKNNVSMWVFLISYMLSIVIGSIFLTFIDSTNFPISVTTGTIFLLALGIFLIFMLVPYVLSTLDFLNTERIIKRLADIINTKTINQQTDPFQSIFDVIYSAIKINDFTTMSTGLLFAEDRFKEIIANDPMNWQNDYILFRFFDDIKRCGFLLIEKKEDKYAFEIITRLKTISEWAFAEQSTLVLYRSCNVIEKIGTKACEYSLGSVVDHAITTLKGITDAIERIEGLSQDQNIKEKWKITLFAFVESIGNIGKILTNYDLIKSSEKVEIALNEIGRFAIEKNLTFDDDFIFKRISAIVFESKKHGKTLLINSHIQSLQMLGGFCVRENHSREAFWILDELKTIGKRSAHNQEGSITLKVVNAIRYIAMDAMQKQMKDVTNKAVELSVNFQLIYPTIFKGQNEIRIFDYNYPDSASVSKEEYDVVWMYEYSKLDEYISPPEDLGEWCDDGAIDVSL